MIRDWETCPGSFTLWQTWDGNPTCLALKPNSGQRGGDQGVPATGGTSEMNPNPLPHCPLHLVLLTKVKGAYPNNHFLSWRAQESDVWTILCIPSPMKRMKNAKSSFHQMDLEHCINRQGTKMSHLWISKVILNIQEIHKTVPWCSPTPVPTPEIECQSFSPHREAGSSSYSGPGGKAVFLGSTVSGKFLGQRYIWKTDTTSLKRLMSSARQMPQVLRRGQQKGGTNRELLPFFNVRSGQKVPSSWW